MVQTIAYLKSKFETGDKPTQQDFYDLIDTIFSFEGSDFDPESISTFLRFQDAGNKWIGKSAIGTDGATYTKAIFFNGDNIYIVEGDNDNYSAITVKSNGTIKQRTVNGGNSGTVNETNMSATETVLDKYFRYGSELALYDRKHLVHLGFVEDALALKLDASSYNNHFKGKYPTLGGLTAAWPTAEAGDYAQVDAGAGSTVSTYYYDIEEGWVLGSSSPSASNTDELPEGSANLYFTNARAVSALASTLSNYLLLSGISNILTGTATNKALSEAQGKVLKDLIDALTTTVSSKASSTYVDAQDAKRTYTKRPIDANLAYANSPVPFYLSSQYFLQFNDTTDEGCRFLETCPQTYSGNGLIVDIHWRGQTATSGDVVWKVEFMRMNDNSSITESFGTATTIISTVQSTLNNKKISSVSIPNSSFASIAAGDLYKMLVTRVGTSGSDTMSGFVLLEAVSLKFS